MDHKNILIIDGHPRGDSYCSALAKAYQEGASGEHAVKLIAVRNLKFDRDFQNQTILEKDIAEAQKDILWANHIVFVTPVWWGGLTPLLRSFIDRTLTAGWAYKYTAKGIPVGLLKGRSAHVIYTQGAPFLFSLFFYRDVFWRTFKNLILKFVGIKPIKRTVISTIQSLSDEQRKAKLEMVRNLGRDGV